MGKYTDAIVTKLSGLCRSIAGGQYEGLDDLFALADNARVGVDLRALAEAFGLMVVQIEAREFRLSNTIEELEETSRQLRVAKEQLQQENTSLRTEMDRLRIEIDHGRKDEEVAEIIETDYFHDLQSRARALRERRNTGQKDR
jgi:regulator of replication initiation timing